MSAVAAWAASTSFSVGDVRRATTVQDTGFVFKVTTAGTSGSSEPVWPRKLESTVVDGGVTWTAISSVYQELQKLNPSAIIELFELKLKEGIHYATGNPDSVTTTQRFHAGTSLNSNGEVVWQGNSYEVRTDDNRINMKETIAKQMARDEKQNKMPIIFGGAYVGNRPMTMTEGVKKENTRQPPKKRASKTGTSALVLSEEGRLTPNKAPIAPSMMKKGGFITKRGPLNRGKKKGK